MMCEWWKNPNSEYTGCPVSICEHKTECKKRRPQKATTVTTTQNVKLEVKSSGVSYLGNTGEAGISGIECNPPGTYHYNVKYVTANWNKPKGETMYYLWQVFLVYGKGDICSPCMPKYVVAKDSEEAKIKSGVYKDIPDRWDTEYVTILCITLGEVKVPMYQLRAKEEK